MLHHALFAALEPLFEPYFIFDSYSSRKNKGTHRAVARLRKLAWRLSCNNTKTVWILHGDIRKFFDSVNHGVLFALIKRRVSDARALVVIRIIIESFSTRKGIGIPLGNVTSQLFSNIYLDRFDQFMTNILCVPYYIRYVDDFVVIGRNDIALEYFVPTIQEFLTSFLCLTLHPGKIVLKKWHQGVDFLGYVSFPYYTILRTKTKRRIFKKVRQENLKSYLGVLKYCRSCGIKKKVLSALQRNTPDAMMHPMKALRLFCFAAVLSLFVIQPVFAARYPNDPYAIDQWFYEKIRMPEAWEKTTGSRKVVVAVIDGPMDIDHPDLVNNLWRNPAELKNGKDDDGNGYTDDINGWDFIHMDPDPSPVTAGAKDALSLHHATTVAGIIGAEGNNSTAGAGMNWQVQIMSLQALDEEGRGLVSNVIKAIRYAIAKKVDVVNLSFVGEGFDTEFYDVIKDAYNAGIVVVAASGNDNDALEGGNLNFKKRYPVCYDSDVDIPFILGVAALRKDDTMAAFSNYGSACIDISAPGASISSLGVHAPSDGFGSQFITGLSGTSIAAPFVAGAAALLRAQYPQLSVADIITVLKTTTVAIDSKNSLPRGSLGTGLLDVAAAVGKAGNLKQEKAGAEFVVMFDGGEWTNVRHFSNTFQKKTQFVVPVPFDQIITLEIIDVNRDGVQEVVFAYANKQVGTQLVAYSLQGFKIFESTISPKPVRAVGLSGGDVIRDGKGGITVAFSDNNQLKVILYKANGQIFHWFYGAELGSALESVAVRFSDTGFIYSVIHYGTYVERYTWNFIGAFVTMKKFDVPDGLKRPVAMNGNGSVIAFGAGKGRPSSVSVLEDGKAAAASFIPYGDFTGGSSVMLIDWDVDGKQEVVVGAGPGGGPQVKIFALDGTPEGEFMAHGPQYNRGIIARAFLK